MQWNHNFNQFYKIISLWLWKCVTFSDQILAVVAKCLNLHIKMGPAAFKCMLTMAKMKFPIFSGTGTWTKSPFGSYLEDFSNLESWKCVIMPCRTQTSKWTVLTFTLKWLLEHPNLCSSWLKGGFPHSVIQEHAMKSLF